MVSEPIKTGNESKVFTTGGIFFAMLGYEGSVCCTELFWDMRFDLQTVMLKYNMILHDLLFTSR